MLSLGQYRQELVSKGEVQLFVRHKRHHRRVSCLIHGLLDDYPDMFVITQRRQNDPHDYRLIFTDETNEGRIFGLPHPYQAELDTLEEAYQVLDDCLLGLGLDDRELRHMLDQIRLLQHQQLATRPHPGNPYVNIGWVAGKIRD